MSLLLTLRVARLSAALVIATTAVHAQAQATGNAKAGKELAQAPGGNFEWSCEACHGLDLHGVGAAPSLTGRAPMDIVAQLQAFQKGLRTGAAAAPMKAVADALSEQDMQDLAAWLATVKP